MSTKNDSSNSSTDEPVIQPQTPKEPPKPAPEFPPNRLILDHVEPASTMRDSVIIEVNKTNK